jgi:hypothetical protein
MEPKRIIKPKPGVLSPWQTQVAQSTRNPCLHQQLLAAQAPELLPRFSAHYQKLKALSRPVRRRLQRQWKRSLAGIALLMALGAQPALAATINVRGDCNLVSERRTLMLPEGGCPAGSGADTIVLPRNSTQTLTRVVNTVWPHGASFDPQWHHHRRQWQHDPASSFGT